MDARSRHVVVQGSTVQVFCSRECKDAGLLEDLGLILEAEPPRRRRRLALGIAGLGALFVAVGTPLGLWLLGQDMASGPGADAGPHIARAEGSDAEESPDAAPRRYGPAWPPTEKEWIDMLARDTWIHPLAGPVRRMPSRHSRVFGAARAGDRPAECKNGHCGVDLGGEADWGEPVLAVHEGVVERVERGPNRNGGLWVRLSHRQGTVFTEYFHLAAIPRHIRPGRRVEMGEMIGLLGETGIQHSGAHLHFTLLVKPAEDMPTQFVDPEPLIALWPLKVPVECSDESLVSPLEPPGLVRGAASGHKRRRRHKKKPEERAERELAAAEAKKKGGETDEVSPPAPGKEKGTEAAGQ